MTLDMGRTIGRRLNMSVENLTLPEKAVFTVNEMAAVLGLHPHTVYDAIKSGAVHANRVGRQFLIPRNEYARLTGTDAPQSNP